MLACDPCDRVPLLELFLDNLRGGEPTPLMSGIMAEAGFWADWASTDELKAFCLASFTRLSAADQRAFLAYVQRRAAA